MSAASDEPSAPRPFRLSEVTRRLRDILLPATEKQFWVRAQFVPDKVRSSGNLYGNLVETDARGKEIARLRVIIWRADLERIEAVLRSRGADRLEILRTGGEVCALCSVRFHEVFGLNLTLFDVDPDLGESQIDRNRRMVLEALQQDGLLDANKGRPLTVVPLRIGLVTAPDSAAYADFLRTLTASGFSFQVVHVAATMQGAATASSVVSAIRRLQGESLDLICVIRGGGSPIDLAWLDHETIARAVAACPLPIWVGIGHEIDFGVLDHIAHASHKTPTALAEALVGRLREVDNRLTAAGERLMETGPRLVDLARQRLETRENGLRQGTRKHQQIQDARFGQKVSRLQTLLAQHTGRKAGRFQKAATTLLERSRAILDRLDARLATAVGSLRADAFRLAGTWEEKLARSTVGLVQGSRKQLTAIHGRVSRRPQALQAIIDRETARLAEALSAARARLQTASRGRQESGEQRLRWRQGRITAEAYVRRVALADERLAAKLAHVESLRPKRLLARGYSITRTASGAIVRSISDIPLGTVLLTSLVDGTATSNVTKTEERSDG